MDKDVLVKVEGVSKKFARDLKRSLRYGVQDIAREMLGKSRMTELRKSEFWAVKDVSFELRRGECLGLIGHNGAGKSTLLKMLNGLLKPDEGSIEIRGRVAALIELGAGFNPILTGRENIYNNASVLGFTKEETDEKLDEIIEFSELGEFIDAPVQSYSSGMKVRLGFAVAAQMEPDVLIIDEVLAVGDLGFRTKCFKRINEMLQNSAVIFVSHAVNQISRTCTDVMLLDHGEVEYRGKDVTTGIDLYLGKFETETAQVIGNDSIISIESVKIYDQESSDDKLHYGNKINIEVDLKNISGLKKEIAVMISFLDQELKYVSMLNSEFSSVFYKIESGENKTIYATFDNLFAGGIYALNVHIIASNDGVVSHGLCTYQAVTDFQVRGNKVYTKIPIQFNGSWS